MRTLYGLLERKPGDYMTLDGRYRVYRDPASGRQRGGYGSNVWRVYERAAGPRGRAIWRVVAIGGRRDWETYRGAVADLRRLRRELAEKARVVTGS